MVRLDATELLDFQGVGLGDGLVECHYGTGAQQYTWYGF